ncbi:MipA/OmpV family protein [Prosthecomicrobium sp. N25]|uniref:MipA/OmpV family protein n=1 Tax=Prosthecomicrobium sp. N25 TaxID=3129254 RepID=UPI003077A511
MRRPVLIAALLAALLPGAAAAQTAAPAWSGAVVTLGGGPKLQPEWEGSKNYLIAPFPIVSLRFSVNPFTGEPTSDLGFGVAPAFRYLDSRSGGVDKRLRGTERVDAALEVGAVVDYTLPYARAFVELRQGFGGHDGIVGDLGVEGILRPAPGVKVSVGPRLSFADDDYMDTYFSVSPKVAGRTNFSRYEADAGIKSYGAGARIDWDFNPHWLVRLDGTWNRLTGDAAKSPIVRRAGDRDQFTLGLGAAYRFGIDGK